MGTKGQLRTDGRTSSAVHQALRPRFTTTPTILTRQEVHPEKAGARNFPLLPRVPESLVIQPTFSAGPAPGEEGPGEGAAAHSTGGGGQEGAVEKLPGACSRRFSGAGPPHQSWISGEARLAAGDDGLLWVVGSDRHLDRRLLRSGPRLTTKQVALGDW